MFTPDPHHYAYEEVEPTVEKLFLQFARAGKIGSVLDVGCGNGLLGESLNNAGHSVTGIDSHPAAVANARNRIGEVIDADLTVVPETLTGRQFDYLLFADVLEHVADPLGVLSEYRPHLDPAGRLVVSLPNVAVWDNRLRLLMGRFNYTDAGVMDRTHLRFFTFASARRLVETAGYQIETVTLNPGIVRAFLPLIKWMMGKSGDGGALMDSPAYKFYAKFILPPERLVASLLKGLFGFRIVIVARCAGD